MRLTEVSVTMGEGQIAPKEGWEPHPMSSWIAYAVQEDLAHYFGSPWLMLDDWIVFGPENGSRVDILFERTGSASIQVRCDSRSDAPQFLALITDIARIHNFQLYSPATQKLIEPEISQVQIAMARHMSGSWH